MRFTIRGTEYGIDRNLIVRSVQGVTPNPTDGRHKHCVDIGGVAYPIKQPVHLATGIPVIGFTAQDAYRILAKLGFVVRDLRPEGPPVVSGAEPDVDSLRFPVILERDEDGYIVASCPSLPGCHSQGRTKDQAIANVTEAIRGYVASMKKHDEPVPSGQEVVLVDIPA